MSCTQVTPALLRSLTLSDFLALRPREGLGLSGPPQPAGVREPQGAFLGAMGLDEGRG